MSGPFTTKGPLGILRRAGYSTGVRLYTRTLSREDADTGTILITKDRWRRFPPPMQEFPIEAAGERFVTTIVAEDCACVPPPHQHLHLGAQHFRDRLAFTAGATITIDEDGGIYRIANG